MVTEICPNAGIDAGTSKAEANMLPCNHFAFIMLSPFFDYLIFDADSGHMSAHGCHTFHHDLTTKTPPLPPIFLKKPSKEALPPSFKKSA